jgi:hypothetical protein
MEFENNILLQLISEKHIPINDDVSRDFEILEKPYVAGMIYVEYISEKPYVADQITYTMIIPIKIYYKKIAINRDGRITEILN